jgi:hypothetical protein
MCLELKISINPFIYHSGIIICKKTLHLLYHSQPIWMQKQLVFINRLSQLLRLDHVIRMVENPSRATVYFKQVLHKNLFPNKVTGILYVVIHLFSHASFHLPSLCLSPVFFFISEMLTWTNHDEITFSTAIFFFFFSFVLSFK